MYTNTTISTEIRLESEVESNNQYDIPRECEEITKEARNRVRPATVVKKYDIPYVGGYSSDGTTVYIDKDLPETFIASTGVLVNVHKYLTIHEITEIALIRNASMTYNEAHRIAVGAEIAALQQDKCPVDEYYHFLFSHVNKKLRADAITSVPRDLEILPYAEDNLSDIVRRLQELGTVTSNAD